MEAEIACLRKFVCKLETTVSKLTTEVDDMKRERGMLAAVWNTKETKFKEIIKVRVSSYQKIIITIVPLDIPSRAVISQLGLLSLASLRGRLIEYQLRLGVTAGM